MRKQPPIALSFNGAAPIHKYDLPTESILLYRPDLDCCTAESAATNRIILNIGEKCHLTLISLHHLLQMSLISNIQTVSNGLVLFLL